MVVTKVSDKNEIDAKYHIAVVIINYSYFHFLTEML